MKVSVDVMLKMLEDGSHIDIASFGGLHNVALSFLPEGIDGNTGKNYQIAVKEFAEEAIKGAGSRIVLSPRNRDNTTWSKEAETSFIYRLIQKSNAYLLNGEVGGDLPLLSAYYENGKVYLTDGGHRLYTLVKLLSGEIKIPKASDTLINSDKSFRNINDELGGKYLFHKDSSLMVSGDNGDKVRDAIENFPLIIHFWAKQGTDVAGINGGRTMDEKEVMKQTYFETPLYSELYALRYTSHFCSKNGKEDDLAVGDMSWMLGRIMGLKGSKNVISRNVLSQLQNHPEVAKLFSEFNTILRKKEFSFIFKYNRGAYNLPVSRLSGLHHLVHSAMLADGSLRTAMAPYIKKRNSAPGRGLCKYTFEDAMSDLQNSKKLLSELELHVIYANCFVERMAGLWAALSTHVISNSTFEEVSSHLANNATNSYKAGRDYARRLADVFAKNKVLSTKTYNKMKSYLGMSLEECIEGGIL